MAERNSNVVRTWLCSAMLILLVAILGCPANAASGKTIYLLAGQKETIRINGESGKAKWKSSDKKVVTVTKRGVVKGKKAGKATVTAKTSSKTYKYKIRVVKPELKYQYSTLTVGQKEQLEIPHCTVTVKWKSNNKKVLRVNGNGVVTAVSKGSAKITATVLGKKLAAKIKVTGADTFSKVRERSLKISSGNLTITKRPGRTLYYTGSDTIDYLAESMIREAGVRASMSDEEIIKRLYDVGVKRFPTNLQ